MTTVCVRLLMGLSAVPSCNNIDPSTRAVSKSFTLLVKENVHLKPFGDPPKIFNHSVIHLYVHQTNIFFLFLTTAALKSLSRFNFFVYMSFLYYFSPKNQISPSSTFKPWLHTSPATKAAAAHPMDYHHITISTACMDCHSANQQGT